MKLYGHYCTSLTLWFHLRHHIVTSLLLKYKWWAYKWWALMFGIHSDPTQWIIIKLFSLRRCRKCWNLLSIICSNQQWHYQVWKCLNSSPAFAAIISQLVMMSVLEHCIRQKWSDADKAFFGLLGELFSQTFCLKDILWMKNYTVHYCRIDYDCRPAVPSSWLGLL